jgi:protein-tyrosine phosphatase
LFHQAPQQQEHGMSRMVHVPPRACVAALSAKAFLLALLATLGLGSVGLAQQTPQARNAGLLIFDTKPNLAPPRNFRLASGGSDPKAMGAWPRLSGSAEFDAAGLDWLLAHLPGPLTIVDLRQESHGFLNGRDISWYAAKDQGNYGKTPEEVEKDERALLAGLAASGQVEVHEIVKKNDQGGVAEATSQTVTVHSVRSEAEFVGQKGIGYLRLYVTDEMGPTDDQVDRFVRYIRELPPDVWLHMHCHAGRGRTTTFMVMRALLANPSGASLGAIAAAQVQAGGPDLLETDKENWERALAETRLRFLRRFAAYAAENQGGKPLLWSEWIARTP